MTSADIAREFVRLGLPRMEAMLLRLADDGEEYVLDVPRGELVPDLDDAATLGLVERWVVGLWSRRGFTCWAHEVLSDGAHVFRVHDPLVCDSHEFDGSEYEDVLLAAARAAKGGSDGE